MCKERGFQDGSSVYEDKLVLYFQEVVLKRLRRTKRGKQATSTEDGQAIEHKLAARTVQTYAAALVSLYYTQKAILKEQTRSEFERKKSEFVDRGTATLQDGYWLTDFENVVRGCWTSAISGFEVYNT